MFGDDGSWRSLKRELSLTVHCGEITLGCRDCGYRVTLSVPLAADTAGALLLHMGT